MKFKANMKQPLDFLLSKTGHFAIKFVSVITHFHYVCKIWNGIRTSGQRIWNVELYEYFSVLARISFFREQLSYETLNIMNNKISNGLKSDLFLSN